ncbi:hypothetical protein A2U01_0043548, partial [Trifolium medium]|nr:hypothetical protein [Trifolium medium]
VARYLSANGPMVTMRDGEIRDVKWKPLRRLDNHWGNSYWNVSGRYASRVSEPSDVRRRLYGWWIP